MNLIQTIQFPGVPAAKLYNSYLNSVEHGKMTTSGEGEDKTIWFRPGTGNQDYNLKATILELVPDRLIVQTWKNLPFTLATNQDLVTDLPSTLVLSFRTTAFGSEIRMAHINVPDYEVIIEQTGEKDALGNIINKQAIHQSPFKNSQMKEFMLLIRNEGDGKADLSPEQQQAFLKACQDYIEDLMKNGNLRNAQPLVREGKIISGSAGNFTEGPYKETRELIVGYYHIMAKDLDEAIAIAKRNPEFAFIKGAKIEVRPIKMIEQSTNFTYPTK